MNKSTRTSPADDAVLDQIKADQAAGKDPFGDDEPIVAESIEEQAVRAQAELDAANGVTPPADAGEGADEPEEDAGDDGTAAAEEAGEAGGQDATEAEDKADADGAATEEPAGSQQEPAAAAAATAELEGDTDDDFDDAPAPYRGTPLAELATKRGELVAKKAESFRKLMAGEIEPDVHSKTESEVQGELDRILKQEAKAEAREEALQDYQMKVVGNIMATGKKQGLDYAADPRAQRQFDSALQALLGDPEEKRPFKALARDAHSVVLGLRGIATAKATAAAPAAAPAPKPPEAKAPAGKPPPRAAAKPPVTLRNTPAAATPNAGASVADAMATLKGPAYDAAWAKLTPAQKAQLRGE